MKRDPGLYTYGVTVYWVQHGGDLRVWDYEHQEFVIPEAPPSEFVVLNMIDMRERIWPRVHFL